MDFCGSEGIAGGNVGEPHEGMHQGELSWVVELETGNAFACRGNCRFGEASQLAAVDKSFEDVLLDVEIVVVDV